MAISREAYFLWCSDGKPECHDERYWDEAVRKAVRAKCSVTEATTPGLGCEEGG